MGHAFRREGFPSPLLRFIDLAGTVAVERPLRCSREVGALIGFQLTGSRQFLEAHPRRRPDDGGVPRA